MQGGVRRVSCGVVVTDGVRLLLGHATGSPRWDIPKGMMEAGEPELGCAVRELREETGLVVGAEALVGLGRHAYLRDKDLVLFAWWPKVMPAPGELRCATMAVLRDGRRVPELDRFGVFEWEAGTALVGRNLARVLGLVRGLVAAAGDGRPAMR